MSITEVYLIRHGIAAAREEGVTDEERQLTPKGVAKTQRIAQRLSDLGLQFDTLLTSPLVRAQQTAKILHAAGLASQLQNYPPLRPDGNLADWLSWLSQWQFASTNINDSESEPFRNPVHTSVALVGHEPNLSQWAQQLVCGHQHSHWTLKKAGIIGLQVPEAARAIGQSQLFWLSPPRLLL